MAKIPFSKLGLSKNQNIKNIQWGEYEIEIKQYLPINDKLTLISNVINASHDEKNYSNPVKNDMFIALEIMYFYTNINFTDKQKEDVAKLYDLIVGNGLYAAIINAIPASEYNTLICGIRESINAIYSYQNSVLGILDTINTDYKDMSLDVNQLTQELNPDNIALLQDIMTKLG